ncbi:ATP phosphoribosyltransferase (homohexameric) [Desulfobotulus alkaliphilus]|uniref:ATP phosphoribosyltransferase n=1 Tax=Desulfobotulus alkaliphilus TaxID=622671 RepID=A0A562S7A8_9BACT|nr:ATP phosphoribosyltransferase [Desulfobotulus alkaliphilus]TWI77309.1 ATP phosphoribosyltransferase (homohexameric) [Desulfobotulus alkaliphilus]
MLQIALPNKGSLSEDSVRLVREAGYNCRRLGKELIISDVENGIDFFFLRPKDIAVYVRKGILALGITGRDLALDSGADVVEILPLHFGKSKFCYAVPEDSPITPETLEGKRIATSYAALVSKDLEKRGVKAEIVPLDGAVEISIRLGVADLIADVVQTGKTLKDAGLKVVGDVILNSEAVLVGQDEAVLENPLVKTFVDRLQGIVVARDYVIVEYDVPENLLDQACRITPGIESPTVSPLSKKGWMAVKAMAKKKEVNGIMDALTELGARGIMVLDIRTCRI